MNNEKQKSPLDYNMVWYLLDEEGKCLIHPAAGTNLPMWQVLSRKYPMESERQRDILHNISIQELAKQPRLLAETIKEKGWELNEYQIARILKEIGDEDLNSLYATGALEWNGQTTVAQIERTIRRIIFDPLKEYKAEHWRNMINDHEDVVMAYVENSQRAVFGWYITNEENAYYNEMDDEWIWGKSAKWCQEFNCYFLESSLTYSSSMEEWIHPNKTLIYRHCGDVNEWRVADECYYCDYSGDWLAEPPSHRVLQYHSAPPQAIKEPIGANWTIGFEIEKETVYNEETGLQVSEQGDEIEEQPFFWKWETDSSCGIEGVSNAYDLFSSKGIREDIRLSDYIDAPVDTRRAGGHISVKCNEYTRSFGLAQIRPYAGLIYALWRYRLKSEYCSKNKKLDEEAYQDRYDVIRVRGHNFLEFRLPSRVKNRKQLIWRYKLFHCTIRAMKEEKPFDDYLRNVSSLLDEVYGLEKKDKILALSKSFENYLNNGVISSDISEFI